MTSRTVHTIIRYWITQFPLHSEMRGCEFTYPSCYLASCSWMAISLTINTSILTYVVHHNWVLIGKMAVERDRFMLHVYTAESPHAEIEGKGEKNGVITDYSVWYKEAGVTDHLDGEWRQLSIKRSGYNRKPAQGNKRSCILQDKKKRGCTSPVSRVTTAHRRHSGNNMSKHRCVAGKKSRRLPVRTSLCFTEYPDCISRSLAVC